MSRIIDLQWGMVKVPRVKAFQEHQVSTPILTSHFKAIRQAYQGQKRERYFDLEKLSQ